MRSRTLTPMSLTLALQLRPAHLRQAAADRAAGKPRGEKIRDFVIVVDTSESTAGELVKSFLKETFALLTSQDSFFRKCRILVMQADNAVREETWLTDLDALDRYTARFTLVGGGGTDFRPAFARIAALRREGSLRDLQGVLYFTGRQGHLPGQAPTV